jgi:hypothetical protein
MRRIVVRRSPVHGSGVFALTNIPSGEFLVEYKGEVTSWRVASQRYQRNRAEDGHTFFFGLDGAYVIDGARGGNSARWLNRGDLLAVSRRRRSAVRGSIAFLASTPQPLKGQGPASFGQNLSENHRWPLYQIICSSRHRNDQHRRKGKRHP